MVQIFVAAFKISAPVEFSRWNFVANLYLVGVLFENSVTFIWDFPGLMLRLYNLHFLD